VSGNPGGRPKAALDVQALARQHTVRAIETLVDALGDERLRVSAAVHLLERGWGKPVQPLASDPDRPVVFQWATPVAIPLEAARDIAVSFANGNGHDA